MLKFFYEEIDFKVPQSLKTSKWLKNISLSEGYKLGDLNYIFCSDDYLLEINKQYLEHDYYTDIITFDNSEEEGKLEGDIYVSIDRVKDNAINIGVSFDIELRRVLVHGLLHLIGFEDSDDDLKQQMRAKEDECLLLY
ncbi:rRNA maturation RNase YbeY [Dyadobacter psychrotolerans]|uniref:Endoribonuclease YbeY n=1 Tax=Dyadobacter psychrotolerans TaxID=2541721 RepID=A0A4R5D5Z5_9BACT|nr:rRNA maturation RNase YbeY [Dyadobacter psychrotolerans]TDE08859.1 rRNA maturation RNase YbeY [Dyadobacter psychrotolerans]